MSPNDQNPKEDLRRKLSPQQYLCTQEDGTEAPFQNAYWDHHEPGIYVDIVSGEALFSSLDKFDSGSGWPSFTRPLEPAHVVSREDRKLFLPRTEVRSKTADSHLGHVFDDGPAPTGMRYCINSASLRFIPAARLEAEGYGQYRALFASAASPGRGTAGSAHDESSTRQGGEAGREIAILAGGCFWGVQELIRAMPGVIETSVGYSGGNISNPRYEQVKTGSTGHAEAIRIVFDPSRLRFEQLLRDFFRLHDPTTLNRQGNDIGTQYRSAIFFTSDVQRETAERMKAEIDRSGKWKRPLTTEITPAGAFYPAEDYHQDYLQKNPGGYTCHFWRE